MIYAVIAVTKVASNTPRALYSLLILKNPKKAAKLGNAPSVKSIQRLLEPRYKLKVVVNEIPFTCEIIKTQAITPRVFAINPTINPISISFFINPMY
jgi:hypothetical protein